MIPFLSQYLQTFNHHRRYWLTKYERRRATWLAISLLAVIALGIFLWLVQ